MSGILTGSCLLTMFVVRKLGLTLAKLDEVQTGTVGVLSENELPEDKKTT